MRSIGEVNTIINILGYFSIGNIFLTILFNIGWIIQCARECWRVARNYRICKRTPNLHPIYRDVQYLSQQRKLYNLKTHFVKYVLIVMCLSAEICGIIFFFSFSVLYTEPLTSELNNEWIQIQSKYQCYLNYQIAHIIFFPFHLFLYTFGYLQLFLLFVLLSILTRYLAARYLNHSFKRTLIKYISWLAAQFVIVLFCSTIYTFIFSLFLFPFIILLNWIVLLRDNRILSRVLKSNLREIELHSNNKVLYREQLSAFKFYRIFNKTLLISLFLLVSVIILFNLSIVFQFIQSMCILNIVYGIKHPMPNIIQLSSLFIILFDHFVTIILSVLYSLSTSLPIICVTIIPLVRACVKRYKSRHNVYRYNYENIKQPLLKGYK